MIDSTYLYLYDTIKQTFFPINSLRGESHIDFCRQCVIIKLGGGGGVKIITNDVLEFRKIIEFQSS